MPLSDLHVSDPSTLDIELGMQVVNPPGYDLSQDSSRLIGVVKPQLIAGEVRHDITESMLEIVTGVCRSIDQADAELSTMQQITMRVTAGHHLAIRGGGIHPLQKWQCQEVCDDKRYQRNLENFDYLIQQATVFGQHAYIDCASGGDVVYLLHDLSRFVPHFIALSAASLYMQTSDTWFACTRPDVFSEFPDNGPMPWVNNWQKSERLFRRLAYTSMIDNIKDLHWDIRPSSHPGMVGVRVMDTPLTPDRAASTAGLIQVTARWLLTRRPFKHQECDYLLYKFNRFQAYRFGMAGIVTDVDTGDGCRLSEDTLWLLESTATSADKVGTTSATEVIHLQVKNGHDETQNMCNFVVEGGPLSGLVKKHCEVWAGL